MKKYIIYSLIITLTCGLGACNNDEDVDKANSIFSTEEVERSPLHPSIQHCIEISYGR